MKPTTPNSGSPIVKTAVSPVRRAFARDTNWLLPSLVFVLFFAILPLRAQLPAGTEDTTAPQPAPDAALLAQANDALQKSDYPTALKLLTKLSHDNPKDAHILFDLGLTEDDLGQDSEAAAAYRDAIAADARYAAPHLALGLLLARSGKTTDAHAELVAAASLPPDDPALTARALRALAQLDRNAEPADARDELLAALKLTPETPGDVLLSGQIAEALGDMPLAETAYTRALASAPNDSEITAALAHVLLRQNKATAAEPLLTKALAAHPGDTALTAQLASTYLAEDDPAKSALAVPLVETLHQQHPDEVSITRLLARLYTRTKQPEKADPLYAELLRKTPADPTLIDDYASNLIHLAHFAEAETLLKRATADPAAFPSPEDLAAAYSDLAFAASENKDPATTLQALDLRAKIAPNTAGSVFLAATAHDRLHQYKQASDLYKQFLLLADGKFADQEWEARHRLIALEHMK